MAFHLNSACARHGGRLLRLRQRRNRRRKIHAEGVHCSVGGCQQRLLRKVSIPLRRSHLGVAEYLLNLVEASSSIDEERLSSTPQGHSAAINSGTALATSLAASIKVSWDKCA